MHRLLAFCVLVAVLIGCANTPPIPPTDVPTEFPTLPLPTTAAIPTVASPAPTNIPPTATKIPTVAPIVLPTQPPATETEVTTSSDPVLVGAGDIAVCGTPGAGLTAQLIENIPGTVFTLGDNAYQRGTATEFQDCYDPTWGRFKDRTMPVAGNHEYASPSAKPYFAYFGASAGDTAHGYYSYDRGTWHIVVLNSEVPMDTKSPQNAWLRQDLAAHPAKCVVAMWHRPLFSSGPHGADGSGDNTRPLWQVLYDNHADLILNGHDHDYERFAPQDPQGKADPARGIREIVAGTGGGPPYFIVNLKPNSETHGVGVFGVLKLTLHPSSYNWEFVPVTSKFKDSGSGECH